jgi:hypothetical protein
VNGPHLLTLESEEALRRALMLAQKRDIQVVDIYAPYEIDLPFPEAERDARAIARDGIWAGLIALALVYALQWWARDIAFPFPVGDRGEHPWPAFLLPAVEAGMLLGGAGAFVSFLLRAGLPSLYHPVFDAPGFEEATHARFFIAFADAEAARAIAEACGLENAS